MCVTVLRWIGPGHTGRTFASLCLLKFECFIGDRCSMRLWFHPHVVFKYSYNTWYYNGDDGCFCVVCWIYGTVSCWPWTNRTCVWIAMCGYLTWCEGVTCVFKMSSGHKWSHYYRTVQIHCNGNDGSVALIFIGWTYEMGVMFALYKQRVRLYSCVYVVEFKGVIGDQFSMSL